MDFGLQEGRTITRQEFLNCIKAKMLAQVPGSGGAAARAGSAGDHGLVRRVSSIKRLADKLVSSPTDAQKEEAEARQWRLQRVAGALAGEMGSRGRGLMRAGGRMASRAAAGMTPSSLKARSAHTCRWLRLGLLWARLQGLGGGGGKWVWRACGPEAPGELGRAGCQYRPRGQGWMPVPPSRRQLLGLAWPVHGLLCFGCRDGRVASSVIWEGPVNPRPRAYL